jgi:CelD/BcsL family acetyltransferase involved in cellulose biosynthesis
MMRDDAAATRLAVALETAPDAAALEPQWQALEARADAAFFLSWAWIGPWLNLIPLDRRTLLVRAVAAGETVGLGIAVIAQGEAFLHETGDPGLDNLTIERNGFLVDRRFAESAPQAMLAALLAGSPRCRRLRLAATASPLEAPPGFVLRILKRQKSFALELGAEDFATRLSSNTRAQLRRTVRDFEVLGPLAITAAREPEEAAGFFAELEILHRRYWESRGRRHAFAHPAFAAFHSALIATRCGKGAELLRISAGEAVVGYLYNLKYRGRVLAYQSGFDYALLPEGRPGMLCHALAIRRAQQEGARVYDFLAGDNQLKRQLSTEEDELLTLAFHRDGPLFRAREAAEWAWHGLKALRRRAP